MKLNYINNLNSNICNNNQVFCTLLTNNQMKVTLFVYNLGPISHA